MFPNREGRPIPFLKAISDQSLTSLVSIRKLKFSSIVRGDCRLQNLQIAGGALTHHPSTSCTAPQRMVFP